MTQGRGAARHPREGTASSALRFVREMLSARLVPWPSQLVDSLGTETLSRCRFVALPRGGLFVLGMLAYLLDLRADRVGDVGESGIRPGGSDSAPLVLVDDCALSGLRFSETSRGHRGSGRRVRPSLLAPAAAGRDRSGARATRRGVPSPGRTSWTWRMSFWMKIAGTWEERWRETVGRPRVLVRPARTRVLPMERAGHHDLEHRDG